jgi:hypothetical protein
LTASSDVDDAVVVWTTTFATLHAAPAPGFGADVKSAAGRSDSASHSDLSATMVEVSLPAALGGSRELEQKKEGEN